ncbi:hypothetical protein ABTJ37_20770 [Acinetobacter baumannii]|jgi:hypothetical protein|uniref:hypothetical protein n=1 Tax=Microbacterium TaxID=33882 RepID=UPI0020034231|nr:MULTISPECIES: hypothetical protein [Microbacterium]MCT2087549.1 hypothetical protein [Microbacterium enclense]
MQEQPHDKKSSKAREDHDAGENDGAAHAGSESPEEGAAAMDAAEDAVIDDDHQ